MRTATPDGQLSQGVWDDFVLQVLVLRNRCRAVADAIKEDAPYSAAPELWRALTVAVDGLNQALAGVNVFAADTVLTAVAEELGCDLGGIE